MRCRRTDVGIYSLTGRRRHSHYCLGDVSGVKDGREVLEILLVGVEVEAYLDIVKILFSPTTIFITPSSQPRSYQPMATSWGVYRPKHL